MRIERQGLEVVVLVDAGGVVIDSVDDDEFPARCPGGSDGGCEGSDEEFAAETLAVVGSLDGQFGEEDGGDTGGCTAPDLWWDRLAFDEMGSEREVATY